MADPLSLTTAIITLTNTLQRVISLLETFAHAERRVTEIKRDCVLTHGVLQYVQQQLGSREPPTLPIDGADGPDARLNLRNLLKDNVTQLQDDLNVLASELEALSSAGRPDTRMGRLVARGQVTWKMSYLEGMHRKIVTKRMQLELVLNSLRSVNSPTTERRTSGDSILIASFMRPALSRRRTNESGPLPPPDPETKRKIAKAVKDADKTELEALLQHVSPNFHVRVQGRELSPLHIAAIRGDLAMVNFLIAYDASVDCCGWGEDTPLTLAISHGHPVVALPLIRRGANILLADAQERTPLHHAARQNLYAVVQVLLNNGADVNAYDRAGRTPLMEAVRRNDREIQPDDTHVLRVLLHPNPHGRAADPTMGLLRDHYTPIHHAAAHGYVHDLKLMLGVAEHPGIAAQTGAAVARRLILDSADRTPLWYAARNGHHEVVKLFLSLGADMQINRPTRDPDYPTALWAMAATSTRDDDSSFEGFSALLAANADPNIQRPTTKQTLLHHACLTNNLSLLSLLLSHNANPLLTDTAGQQPLHYAAKQGHSTLLITLLTASPTPLNVNARDNSDTTPLMLAAEQGHDFLLPLLIHKYHADPHLVNNSGYTAFQLACARGQILCAAYLLGCGVDIDAQDNGGNSALHVAAARGEVETVAWLVRMGADVNVRSREAVDGLGTGSRGVVGTPAEVVRGSELGEEVVREVLRVLGEGSDGERRRKRFVVRRVEGGR